MWPFKFLLNGKFYAVLLALLSFGLVVNAQRNNIDHKIENAFKSYFGPKRESIFLHLNKSTYTSGEEIWFKGYIYDRTKRKPFKETSNLYVGIYDRLGNQVNKKLFYACDGYSRGQIPIDNTYKSGTYYVKATTNWMRNFKEDDSYVQKIKILAQDTIIGENSVSLDYDVQFLPECGNLVTGVQTYVGVKAIDQFGLGTQDVTGTIKDETGNIIGDFATNRNGLAKVKLTPRQNLTYHAEVKFINGRTRTFLLPRSVAEGIGMSIEYVNADRILVILGTNVISRKKMDDESFFLLIHRDGLLKKLKVEFPKNKLYTSFLLERKSFQSGMNILTLMDKKGVPILERLFFNSDGLPLGDIEISKKNIEADSTTINLEGVAKNKAKCNLSVSVLPEATKAYRHENNIFTTFLLKPYVKGHIDNPSYYFENMNFKKEKELDLLLLTQGWSKYDWKYIFDNPPEKEFEFENGITITGTVNSKFEKGNELLFYANKSSMPRVIKLGEEQFKFDIHNLFPANGEKIKFSMIKGNGKFTKPPLYINAINNNFTDRIYHPWRNNLDLLKSANESNLTVANFILPDNTIRLEEVTVTEEKQLKQFATPQIFEQNLEKVTQEFERSYPNLLDIIRSNGYHVRIEVNPGIGSPFVQISTRRPLIFSEVQPSPVLYINDIRVHDFEILLDFPTTKIASYYIDRTGGSEHGGAGGVIRVYTRDRGEYSAEWHNAKRKADPIFFDYEITRGFQPAKQFYVPKYSSTTDETFSHYGVVSWISDLSTNAEGKTTFKMQNTLTNNVSLFIEGMAEDGTLFSTIKKISLN